jgi:hypothetical protein
MGGDYFFWRSNFNSVSGRFWSGSHAAFQLALAIDFTEGTNFEFLRGRCHVVRSERFGADDAASLDVDPGEHPGIAGGGGLGLVLSRTLHERLRRISFLPCAAVASGKKSRPRSMTQKSDPTNGRVKILIVQKLRVIGKTRRGLATIELVAVWRVRTVVMMSVSPGA